jgi:hypothetical protein
MDQVMIWHKGRGSLRTASKDTWVGKRREREREQHTTVGIACQMRNHGQLLLLVVWSLMLEWYWLERGRAG